MDFCKSNSFVFNQQLNAVTLKTFSTGQKICVYDTPGIQREPLRNDNNINAALIADLQMTIAGHVMHGYEVNKCIMALVLSLASIT